MPNQVSKCANCPKDFLIITQEQTFYQNKKLPFPSQCPECRRERRRGLRNQRNLYQRICDKCKVALLSTYSPTSPYIVYCEKCYLENL